MKKSRYDVSELLEAQFEPGSRRRVLRNRLGIRSSRAMDQAETSALKAAMDDFLKAYDEQHRFTVFDIRGMHKQWLGEIYGWAGEYRQVNLSKDGFAFAAAMRVPALMQAFDHQVQGRHTPCRAGARQEVVKALAETHVELVLIHPFREENGRIARALSTLMALQARLPPLDFRSITGKKKDAYFVAIQAGMDRDYSRMEDLFEEIIDRSLADS